MEVISLHTDPEAMTPVIPLDEKKVLKELAVNLIRKAALLDNILIDGTRDAVRRIIEPMNAYYTNLIEGIKTFPMDIHEALERKNLPVDKNERQKQLEAIAIIEVSRLMKIKVHDEFSIFSGGFLELLHGEFYKRIPAEYRYALTKSGNKIKIHPGLIRETNVYVGKHEAPEAGRLTAFLEFFFRNYNNTMPRESTERIIAIAASHHRLAWIHPFVDGNGRVTRLFSEAWLMREQLNLNGLWSISRGLSRGRANYYLRLANADSKRLNDYDGRGNLSDKGLFEFCKFFLETCIDQVEFMNESLKHETLLNRLNRLTDKLIYEEKLRKEAKFILEYAFLKGHISTGAEVERITGKSENVARAVWKDLVAEGWLITNVSNKLQINFPLKYAPYLFPGLYPADTEAQLL